MRRCKSIHRRVMRGKGVGVLVTRGRDGHLGSMKRAIMFTLAVMLAGAAALLLDGNLRRGEVADAARFASFQERSGARSSPLAGAWEAREYHLAGGPVHGVEGRIFFTDSEWLVLFFVLSPAGEPGRGSAEGGSYTLDGDRLVFAHRWNLSAGEAMEGLEESPLRMEVRGASEAPVEPTRIEVDENRLTLFFPSGNAMSFERSS